MWLQVQGLQDTVKDLSHQYKELKDRLDQASHPSLAGNKISPDLRASYLELQLPDETETCGPFLTHFWQWIVVLEAETLWPMSANLPAMLYAKSSSQLSGCFGSKIEPGISASPKA